LHRYQEVAEEERRKKEKKGFCGKWVEMKLFLWRNEEYN